MTGTTGELRLSYRTAARLKDWSMDESGRVQARRVASNQIMLDRPGPFSLWLQVGRRAWVWEQAAVADAGDPFVVQTTGSPIVRDL